MKKILTFVTLMTSAPTIFAAEVISGVTLRNAGDAIVMQPLPTYRSLNGLGMTVWASSTTDTFGNIIMGGTYKNTSGNRFVVAIINPNKMSENSLTIVPAFSTGSNENCAAVTTDQLGNVIVAGTSSDALGNTYFAAARLLAKKGVLDRSFGTNGFVRITSPIANGGPTSPFNDQCNAVTVGKNGIITLAGTSTDPFGTSYFAVVQLTNTGSLNLNFGRSGRLYIGRIPGEVDRGTLAGGVNDVCDAVTIDQNNNILLTGTSADQQGSEYLALARIPAGL